MHSGIQKEAISLYRRYLTTAKQKPTAVRAKFTLFARYTFRTQAALAGPRDIAAIEHLLRKGKRQLEGWADSGVTDCVLSEEIKHWERNAGVRIKSWQTR